VLELSLTAAFLVGLLGGGHCAGMCGGIVGAVTVTLPGSRPQWPFLLAYNFGRIATYVLAGLLAGAIGASSFFLDHLLPIEKILYALANVMLILLGLYLAGIWRVLTRLERVGGLLWQRLQPYSRKLLPVRTVPQAVLLGTLWGWLPCGLVYSLLVAAVATAKPAEGGLLMLAFGMGTLPALLTMGMAAVQVKAWLQHLWVRRISGMMVLAFGVNGLLQLMR
jgi:sulfite exporter TauE/SafE